MPRACPPSQRRRGLPVRALSGDRRAVNESRRRPLPDGLYTRADLDQIASTIALLREALEAEAPDDEDAEAELIGGEVGSVFASDP